MSTLLNRLIVRVYAHTPSAVRLRIVRYFTPNYTAGVVCLLVRQNGDVLFLRNTYRQGWALPGGLLGRHERPEYAARREVFEELGIEVDVPEPYRASTLSNSHMVTFFALARVTQDQVAAIKADPVEIKELKWFSPTSMPDLDQEIAPLVERDRSAVLGLS